MRILFVLFLLGCAGGAAVAQNHHPCAGDAIAKAMPLLKLHFDQAEQLENAAVDNKVKMLSPIKGRRGKLDVLEVWGYIYKSNYRMRFIYPRGTDSCVLVGQEILEAAWIRR